MSTQARDPVPEVIRKLLPRRGIYGAGGGLTSAPWRTVVDFDSLRIETGTGTTQNALSFGPLAHSSVRTLAPEEVSALQALAARVRREPAPVPTAPNADYDEVLVLVDATGALYLEGFGPIQSGAAGELIRYLQPR